MSISFTLAPDTQIIYTQVTGEIHLSEFAAFMLTLARQNLLNRPQLIDARDSSFEMTAAEMRGFAEFMEQHRKTQGPARVAFVTNSDSLYGMMRMYMVYSENFDPGFNVFRSFQEAELWIRAPDK
jgi:hypothetical protein